MITVISMSQARRRLRRIAQLVAKGHVFIVTKNGRPSVMIDTPEQWNNPKCGNFREGEHLHSTVKQLYQAHHGPEL